MLFANDEPQDRWAKLLPIYLSGRVTSTYITFVSPDIEGNYDAVKETLLSSLGDTPKHAAQQWWILEKSHSETYDYYGTTMVQTLSRMCQPWQDKHTIINQMALSKFLFKLPTDAASFV